MKKRDKHRFKGATLRPKCSFLGSMKGTARVLGDIVAPSRHEPWDAELGIAYRGEKASSSTTLESEARPRMTLRNDGDKPMKVSRTVDADQSALAPRSADNTPPSATNSPGTPLWGCMKGTFKITGDIVGAEWDEPHDPATEPDYRVEYGEPFHQESEVPHA